MRKLILIAGLILAVQAGCSPRLSQSQAQAQAQEITRQEMLRGSVTPEREWWDVLHYDLKVQ
ncbi:MAG TPA: hypothetical protein VJS64_14715, partial [Pyrinomonadaceae bacterium]|nr:hypothetical protein [Pyrinomonadaceae bacterium]